MILLKSGFFKWCLGLISIFTLIVSLILVPLLQAEAATTLFELAEKRIQQDKPFVSESIDAVSYTDLTLSFVYDATTLDGFATSSGQDQLSYGWQVGSDKHVLGTILGLAGSTTAEHGVINAVLPATAEMSNLVIFIEVAANSTSTSDKVEVKNISLSGELKSIPDPVDVCANLDGIQLEVPTGYESKSTGQCTLVVANPDPESDPVPVDLCTNLDGMQESLPANYEKNEAGDCVPVLPPVIDVCPNLDGVQNEIPTKYTKDNSGNCVLVVIQPEPENPPQICPKGYARWVNKFNGGTIWQADDVYKSVILVGKNEDRRRNFALNRHIYIPGPTEVGDRYYHRFGKISHICVR